MTPYYQDDLVTLYLGDCREVTEWLAGDVLVTDPPYGVRWEASYGGRRADQQARNGASDRKRDVIQNDATPDVRDVALSTWGKRPAIVFGSWRVARPERVHALLIWHKEGAYSALVHAPFFTNHEEIYALGSEWPMPVKPLRSVLTTTEHRSQAVRDGGHPTPKPVGLMETLITACPPGMIADPFAGSGTTLVAAKRLGRRCIGVEIEERYCEIAARRLDQGVLDFGEPA
jgi:hypothetical protein